MREMVIDYIGTVGVLFFLIIIFVLIKASIEGEDPYERNEK